MIDLSLEHLVHKVPGLTPSATCEILMEDLPLKK
jgi:hypothetical protein